MPPVRIGAVGYLNARPLTWALDRSPETFVEVEQAALSLSRLVGQLRDGTFEPPNLGLHGPRQK